MAPAKSALIKATCDELRARLDTLARAAREAHEAATDPGSRAESKYDTRSLEASYLASGQARQVEDLLEALRVFESLRLPEFDESGVVEPGALVEVEMADGTAWFLLAPAAGGLELSVAGVVVTLLTPESPLYQSLLGLEVGDELDRPPLHLLGFC